MRDQTTLVQKADVVLKICRLVAQNRPASDPRVCTHSECTEMMTSHRSGGDELIVRDATGVIA